MDVTQPEYVEVVISKNGTVWVNVNESCIFRLCKAGKLVVSIEKGPKHIVIKKGPTK